MRKLTFRIYLKKKVEMRDVVSPSPSRSALRVVKNAIHQSYVDQQATREKATTLRSN